MKRFSQETRDFYEELLAGRTLEDKAKVLEIAERQKYHYYCDCCDRWTTEQSVKFENAWNEIIQMQHEIDALLRSNIKGERE